MKERESIRTLCDKLRRERDRAVSELAEALRDLDEVKKNRNEVFSSTFSILSNSVNFVFHFHTFHSISSIHPLLIIVINFTQFYTPFFIHFSFIHSQVPGHTFHKLWYGLGNLNVIIYEQSMKNDDVHHRWARRTRSFVRESSVWRRTPAFGCFKDPSARVTAETLPLTLISRCI